MARILVLGSSYGLLPGVRLALAGHYVTFVGRPEEVAAMASEPLRLLLPDRRGGTGFDLAAPAERIALTAPEQANPSAVDLVLLAMQEPHYADPAISALLSLIGTSGTPCLSIMNLPPPPFLIRLGIDPDRLGGVFAGMQAWRQLDPERVTLACPDAQALRLDPDLPGVLTTTLPSNFKAAPFARPGDQSLLEDLSRDWARFKVDGQRPPVQLLAQQSLYAPLAKWPMLIAGNCRCLTENGPRSIGEAVHADLAASEVLYEAVMALALALGARQTDLVPFAAYAKAAHGLTRPSSLARALANGAVQVERIDLLVLRLLEQTGLDPAPLLPIVSTIEARLAANAA